MDDFNIEELIKEAEKIANNKDIIYEDVIPFSENESINKPKEKKELSTKDFEDYCLSRTKNDMKIVMTIQDILFIFFDSLMQNDNPVILMNNDVLTKLALLIPYYLKAYGIIIKEKDVE